MSKKRNTKKVDSEAAKNVDIIFLDWLYDQLEILPSNTVKDVKIIFRKSFPVGELKSQLQKGPNFVSLYDLYVDYCTSVKKDVKDLGSFVSILRILDFNLSQHNNYVGYYVKLKLI